jgi:hypothetical protein
MKEQQPADMPAQDSSVLSLPKAQNNTKLGT